MYIRLSIRFIYVYVNVYMNTNIYIYLFLYIYIYIYNTNETKILPYTVFHVATIRVATIIRGLT